MSPRRTRALALVAVMPGLLIGCVGTEQPVGTAEPDNAPTAMPPADEPAELDPDPDVQVYLPTGDEASALVVMVPGGGWVSADPSGLVPLAETLAQEGVSTATITYRAAAAGEYFPVPAEDVWCGYALAVESVTEQRGAPERVVVLGHSAGAHLSALVSLTPEAYFADCETEAPPPDGLIGLAGPYDIVAAGAPAVALLGSGVGDEETLAAANPVRHVEERAEMSALLAHGLADRLVPVEFTESFAAALSQGGHVVTERYLDGVDHGQVYQPDVIAPVILDWLGE